MLDTAPTRKLSNWPNSKGSRKWSPSGACEWAAVSLAGELVCGVEVAEEEYYDHYWAALGLDIGMA